MENEKNKNQDQELKEGVELMENKNNETNQEVITTPVEDVVTESKEDKTIVEANTNIDKVDNDNINDAKEESEEESEEDIDSNIIIGKITGCAKLRMREKAEPNATEVTTINETEDILIDLKNSTNDFYKVEVNGLHGYSMKKFIKID